MDLLVRWLMGQIRAYLHNERGQDVIVVLLLIFIIWLLVTGRKVVVQ
jgi:hypothetical protein